MFAKLPSTDRLRRIVKVCIVDGVTPCKLIQCKRPPFAMRKIAFCKVICGILQGKRWPLALLPVIVCARSGL